MHSVIDRQTDRQTDDRMMPITDNTVLQYDRLIMRICNAILHSAVRLLQSSRTTVRHHSSTIRSEKVDPVTCSNRRSPVRRHIVCTCGVADVLFFIGHIFASLTLTTVENVRQTEEDAVIE